LEKGDMDYFKILFEHSPGEAEEDDDKSYCG